MDKIIKKWKKMKWLIIVPVLIVAAVVYTVSGVSDDKTVSVTENTEYDDIQESDSDNILTSSESEQIYVDVGGAVVSPMVVVLDSGSRIYEAIEAAGGTLSDAETKYMNLAAVCEDGEKIYVPSSAEAAEQLNSGELKEPSSLSTDTAGSSTEQSGKVNINTADSTSLQSLTGIGPSMAQRIIDYRSQNGKFSSVDELTNVSGIGEKTLAKIIENICV
jgi:competence protein ComEA